MKERGNNIQHTLITVFDSDGNLKMDTETGFVEVGHEKYEGIEFLNIGNQITSYYS